MKRMTGLDATFLYGETPTVHMHTLKVAVVEPPSCSGEDTWDLLRTELGRRLHLLPAFRSRVVEVPYGLGHPVWVEDPSFDLDFHLHRVAIPAPGTRREMDDVIADVASHPLDRNHPLWEVWMLEGLADGKVAFVAKVHHAVADGGASAQMLAAVMTPEPTEVDPRSDDPGWVSEPIPRPARLALDAVAEFPARAGQLPGLVRSTASGVASTLKSFRTAETHPARPFASPRTRFNKTIVPTRSFATATLPLARVKAVRKALGVTVNDVVLGIAGGALRSFLEATDGLPAEPLLASVPIGLSPVDPEPRLQGNRLSNLFTSLCTDLDDPAERVRRIHEVTKAAKEAHRTLGPEVLERWTEFAPGRVYSFGVRTYGKLGFADRHRPAANAIVSNVRGPDRTLYLAGARLAALYSVGPILDGLGLNITAWSYAGALGFVVLSDREALPDAHALSDRLAGALAELE